MVNALIWKISQWCDSFSPMGFDSRMRKSERASIFRATKSTVQLNDQISCVDKGEIYYADGEMIDVPFV